MEAVVQAIEVTKRNWKSLTLRLAHPKQLYNNKNNQKIDVSSVKRCLGSKKEPIFASRAYFWSGDFFFHHLEHFVKVLLEQVSEPR